MCTPSKRVSLGLPRCVIIGTAAPIIFGSAALEQIAETADSESAIYPVTTPRVAIADGAVAEFGRSPH